MFSTLCTEAATTTTYHHLCMYTIQYNVIREIVNVASGAAALGAVSVVFVFMSTIAYHFYICDYIVLISEV